MQLDKRWKTRLKIAIAVVILAACAAGGYTYYQSQQQEKQAKSVETADVVRRDLKSTVSATGTIIPVDSVEVSPKITARISQVLVKENDQVTAGQTVAILDGKDYEAQRDQAQYKVTNTQLEYDRAKKLYEMGAGTKQALDTAKFNYDTAVSALTEAQSDVAETVITAPMDGIVVGEPKTVGTMAVQGNNNPTVIMRIANTATKQILAKVDETDIGKIQVGQDATFTVDAYTDKTFTAHVSKISKTDTSNTWDVNGTSSTSSSSSSSSSSASVIYYYVTLDVDDPDDVLKLGMTARVDIITSQKQDALVVPMSALKTNDNGSYVVRVNPNGQTEQVSVTTGIYSDDYVEILSGLTQGDKVSITYTASSKSSSSSKNDHQGPPPM